MLIVVQNVCVCVCSAGMFIPRENTNGNYDATAPMELDGGKQGWRRCGRPFNYDLALNRQESTRTRQSVTVTVLDTQTWISLAEDSVHRRLPGVALPHRITAAAVRSSSIGVIQLPSPQLAVVALLLRLSAESHSPLIIPSFIIFGLSSV